MTQLNFKMSHEQDLTQRLVDVYLMFRRALRTAIPKLPITFLMTKRGSLMHMNSQGGLETTATNMAFHLTEFLRDHGAS